MNVLQLPVTSQPRELESRLLLALHACEAGIEPLIGFKSQFRARRIALPPGCFLAHNARQKPEKLGRLAKFGHAVLILDEEALVRQSDEIFLGKHETNAFEFAHHVLCWGEDDRQMWARSDFDLACGTSVVGNPRMDLLRPEMAAYYAPAVERLHATYGDYVLLNTNFPTVNNFVEGEGGVAMANWALDGDGERARRDFLANKRRLYEATLALVRPLAAAIAPLSLVVRPHPNEDHAPWHAAVEGIDNAHAVFEGGVNPWIFGATAMVHNSCTTAVEAAVAGVPVLNFRPWQSPHDNALAHAVGTDCSDAAAMARALEALRAGTARGRTPGQTDLLRRHVASVDGDFSCQRIVDLIANPEGRIAPVSKAPLAERMRMSMQHWRLWWRRFRKLYTARDGRERRALLRRMFPGRPLFTLDFELLYMGPEQFDLMARQYPPLDLGEINASIARMAAATGRFDGMRAVLRPDGLLTIRRKGRG